MKYVLTFINSKTCLLLATIAIFLSSCKKDFLSANGNMTTETRNPGIFTKLHTSGSTPVHVVYGNEYKVEVRGSTNLIPYFKTSVSNGKLEVGYERASVRQDDVEVMVTMPTIALISLSGSSKVDLNGNFPQIDFLDVDISGSAEVMMKSNAAANQVAVAISGSGLVNLEKLLAKNAEVEISGSGDARIAVQDRLKASMSGSGNVYYTGSPLVDSRSSGSGKLIKF